MVLLTLFSSSAYRCDVLMEESVFKDKHKFQNYLQFCFPLKIQTKMGILVI